LQANEGLLAKEERWEQSAECRNADPGIFFYKENEAEARHICQRCEVREECLEFALYHHIQYGIWGGLDETERKTLRRRHQRRRNHASHAQNELGPEIEE